MDVRKSVLHKILLEQMKQDILAFDVEVNNALGMLDESLYQKPRVSGI